jgi:hypothetical protein
MTFENDEDYVRVLFTIFETPKIFLLSLAGTAAKGYFYFTCQNVENTFLDLFRFILDGCTLYIWYVCATGEARLWFFLNDCNAFFIGKQDCIFSQFFFLAM